MRQLTGLDASFLYLETPNAPMHIAGISILAPDGASGALDLDDLLELLRSRLRASPTFSRRLVDVPLNLGKPYWVEDEDFDLQAHVERTQIPEPGGLKELSALVAWELSQPLPRDRPLWAVLLAQGLDGVPGIPKGSAALVARIHHAAIDGVSGAEIMSALYDLTPAGRTEADTAPARKSEDAEPVPSAVSLLRRAGQHLLETPGMIPSTIGQTVKGLARSGAVWGLEKITPPPLPFTAPRSILNRPVTRDRVWSPTLLALDRVRAIRRAAEATVNDVVLALCSGALRRYLEHRDALPEEPLIAMVPVSVRDESERGTGGNLVSAMLVSLATDLSDPIDRLEAIKSAANRSKTHHRAVGARTLSDLGKYIPFALGGVAARLYTRMQLADRHRPIFNVVITNVPGPQVPLYVGGCSMLAHVGSAPIFDGMGLILPIFSYGGRLSIGATSCRKIMPDIELLSGFLKESLEELSTAVGIEA